MNVKQDVSSTFLLGLECKRLCEKLVEFFRLTPSLKHETRDGDQGQKRKNFFEDHLFVHWENYLVVLFTWDNWGLGPSWTFSPPQLH